MYPLKIGHVSAVLSILAIAVIGDTAVPWRAPSTTIQVLPAPWNSVSGLSPAQLQGIRTILRETDANIEAQRRATHDFVVEQHRRSGTPQLVAIDEDLRTRNLAVLARRMARFRIEQLLTTEQINQARIAWSRVLQTVTAPNFQKYQAEQQMAVWCWAAVIQMLYNYNGIPADQSDIVSEIKGSVVPERATVEEIVKGVTSWRVDPKNPALTWSASCEYAAGAPPAQITIGLLERNRLVLVAVDDEHLGVVHRAQYYERPSTISLASVTMFDPATGANSSLTASDVAAHVTGWWNCWAVPSRDRVF